MTEEKRNILTAAVVTTIVYVGTLWQRPMFSPFEYDFAILQMTSATDFSALLYGLFGKALGFNVVSLRLMSALSAIMCALIIRAVTAKESDKNTGNIAAIIYLSTFLVYAWSSCCSPVSLRTLFFTCFATSFYALFEYAKTSRQAFIFAVAAGCSAGFFSIASSGYTAFYIPLAVAAGYAFGKRKSQVLPQLFTSALFAGVIIFVWQKKSGMPAMPVTPAFSWYDLISLAGVLPWVLFVPQVVLGNSRSFWSRNIVIMTIFIAAATLLTIPTTGIAEALNLALPFCAVIFTLALSNTAKDEKLIRLSENCLRWFSLLLLVLAATIVIINLGSSWQIFKNFSFKRYIHLPKAELAGFAVAAAVALIQFKIACDEKISQPWKKVIYVACGAAVLMILLPGTVFSGIKRSLVPDDFFARTLKMYTTVDTAIYADQNCINTVKWVLKDRKVDLITKERLPELAKQVQNRNAAVISTNYEFTRILPKSKMLFVRDKWRIVIFSSAK